MKTLLVALIAGVVFGFGLALSTMVHPEVILDFLHGRDYGLLLVLGAAVVVTAFAYQVLPRVLHGPLLGGRFGQHASTLDARTLGGAAIFGVGWGLAGVCPGPAIAGLGVGNWPLLWSVAGLLVGAYVQGLIERR